MNGDGEGGGVQGCAVNNVSGVVVAIDGGDISAAGLVDSDEVEGVRGGGVRDGGGEGGHIPEVDHVRHVVELGDDVVVKDKALIHGAQIPVCLLYVVREGRVHRDERRRARRVGGGDEALQSLRHVGRARQLQEDAEIAGLRQDVSHVGHSLRRRTRRMPIEDRQ